MTPHRATRADHGGSSEGLMSPHATILTREPDLGAPSGQKRFTAGAAYTRDLSAEELGTAVHAQVARREYASLSPMPASRNQATPTSSRSRRGS
jgi:amidohydrolase ring-opening protein AtzD/TrzD